jgi:hypothetical protein
MFMAAFKIRNIKTLLYRLSTVAIVIFYYYVVEDISYENRVPNEISLIVFIAVWHWISMNYKILEQTRINKTKDY